MKGNTAIGNVKEILHLVFCRPNCSIYSRLVESLSSILSWNNVTDFCRKEVECLAAPVFSDQCLVMLRSICQQPLCSRCEGSFTISNNLLVVHGWINVSRIVLFLFLIYHYSPYSQTILSLQFNLF